jgi:hypothetical protein
VFLNPDGVVDLDFFRETLGKAAKYVLPPEHFDYTGPIHGRRFMDAQFMDHEAIRPMIEAFKGWNTARAAAEPPFDKCLRELTQFSRGLDDGKLRRALRKKRLERLRHTYLRLLRIRHQAQRLTQKDRELLRGVTYFLLSLKTQFLSKRAAK